MAAKKPVNRIRRRNVLEDPSSDPKCNIENGTKANVQVKGGRAMLEGWLNNTLKVKMSDGRVLVGNFFCTDRDANVILGSSNEYLREEDVGIEQPRMLGLVMIPGRHIVSIHHTTDYEWP